jgi:hypothetical protein
LQNIENVEEPSADAAPNQIAATGDVEARRDATLPMRTACPRRSSAPRDDRPVVAARLCGGLGNQLFQFAAGRSLAQRCGARLVLDATYFTLPVVRRKFALAPYRIDSEVVFSGYGYPPTRRVVVLPRPHGFAEHLDGVVDRIVHRLGANGKRVEEAIAAAVTGLRHVRGLPRALRVFGEKAFDYDCEFTTLGAHTYLDGYWQSYRYFDGIADVIRAELTIAREPNPANKSWLARMQRSNSVCVHVRRGDYLSGDHFGHHGICSTDYYARAMRLVAERVENPQFFVFSDDPGWSRQHVGGPNSAFVDANPPDAADDELRLMAACRHHIIANSSLSWWGAWLARHDGQIVIGPDPWFSGRDETPDLFPANWIALPRG